MLLKHFKCPECGHETEHLYDDDKDVMWCYPCRDTYGEDVVMREQPFTYHKYDKHLQHSSWRVKDE